MRHRGLLVAGLATVLSMAPSAMGNPVAAQTGCDPNYGVTSGGCVPADRDYDCPELNGMGIGDIPVIGSDWQRLDGFYNYNGGYWESNPNGLGCEWGGE